MNDNHRSADGQPRKSYGRDLPLGEAWSMDSFLEQVEQVKKTADEVKKAIADQGQRSRVGLGEGYSLSPAGKAASVGLRMDLTETHDLPDPWEVVPNAFGDGIDYFRGAVLAEHVRSDRQDPMSVECFTVHDVMRTVDEALAKGFMRPVRGMRRALPNLAGRFDEYMLAHLARRQHVLEKERRALRAEQRRMADTSQRAGIEARQRRDKIAAMVELERKLTEQKEESYLPPKPKPGNQRSMLVFDKAVESAVYPGMKVIEKVFVLRRPGIQGMCRPRPEWEYMIVAGPVRDWDPTSTTIGTTGNWDWLLGQLRVGETEESFRALMSSMVEF